MIRLRPEMSTTRWQITSLLLALLVLFLSSAAMTIAAWTCATVLACIALRLAWRIYRALREDLADDWSAEGGLRR